MLFNFEGAAFKWGCSSAGRAPALHAGGQEFDPPHLHHGFKLALETKEILNEFLSESEKLKLKVG